MTQRFIFDENVMICAQLETNVSGANDPGCVNLVNQVIGICHTIVFDIELWQRTQSQLNRPAHQRRELGPALLITLANAVRQAEKVEIRQASPPFPEESDIPQGSQDDVYIVRLAVATGATLVTADNALRDDLDACGVQAEYDLSVISPEGALDRL